MMTKEQWYIKLSMKGTDELDSLKKYIETGSIPYYAVKTVEGNHLEFRIGTRRMLISYHINLKESKILFKTYEIVLNEDDYGKFKLKEIPDLEFTSVLSESYYLGKDGIRISLPKDYLNRVEKSYDTI